jgi:hypothetical protein
MKFFNYVCAVVIACGLTAAAAQEAKPPMTVGDALQALGALRTLDGHQVVVKQNGQDVVVVQPWQFKSGALRLAIADDIAILTRLETSTDAARQNIVKEILKDMPPKADGAPPVVAPGSKEMENFVKQYNDLLAVPFAKAVTLTPIDAKALNLDVNEIPVTTLSALSPILNR